MVAGNKKKHAGGRPRKYTDEVIGKYAKELLAFMNDKNNLWLKDFCILKGFPSDNLTEFAKRSEEFRVALKKAKDIQESKFVRLGLSKVSNPAFVIFALKNIAGWRDKQETEITGKGGDVLKIEFI